MDKEVIELAGLVSKLLYGFVVFILAIAGIYWKQYIKLSHVKRTADSAQKTANESEILSQTNDKLLSSLITSISDKEKNQNAICSMRHEFIQKEQSQFAETLKIHGEKLDENNKVMTELRVTMSELNTTIKAKK